MYADDYDEENYEEPSYSITEFDGFCDSLRTQVAASFCESYSENLDEYISLGQVQNLVKQKSIGRNENGEYLITAEIFDDMFDELRIWIYNVGLAKLAAKDLLEVYLDTATDEFVFTIKNPNTTPAKPNISDGK